MNESDKKLVMDLKEWSEVFERQADPCHKILKHAHYRIFQLVFDLNRQIEENEILLRKLEEATWKK